MARSNYYWDRLHELIPSDSYIGRWRGANNALKDLEESYHFYNLEGEDYDAASSYIKGVRNHSAANTLLTVGQGLANTFNSVRDASRTGDTSYWDDIIDSSKSEFGNNYYDNSSVISGFSEPKRFHVGSEDLNPSLWQSALKVGNSAMSGALTGFKLSGGNPWITAGTALASGIATGLGDAAGRKGNEYEADILNRSQDYNIQMNSLRRQTAADQAHDYQFGNAWGSRKAEGGKIERRSMTIQEFADAVSGKSAANVSRSAGIVRQRCKGGLMVRIKM